MLIPAHSCVSVPLLTSPAIPSCSCLPLLCSPCRWRMMGAPRTRSSKTPRMSGEPSAKWRWGRERRRVMSPCIDLRGRNMRGNIPGNMGVGAETWDNSHHHGVLWTIFSKPVHVCLHPAAACVWLGWFREIGVLHVLVSVVLRCPTHYGTHYHRTAHFVCLLHKQCASPVPLPPTAGWGGQGPEAQERPLGRGHSRVFKVGCGAIYLNLTSAALASLEERRVLRMYAQQGLAKLARCS